MKWVGNILWIILGGLFASLSWFLAGLLLCVTIIGIPFGLQAFKFAKVFLFPFGKEIHTNFDKHPIMNIAWLLFVGWGMTLSYLFIALLCAITIIGIPFAKQWYKLAKFTFLPFGATVSS